ncbi:MAG TPA: TlpA disulfide reductase family protein [Pyrinomonadaceae bacterium]|nr:TlpA disulfide reductase family protein [Pyrinomonadaceae bacterium]
MLKSAPLTFALLMIISVAAVAQNTATPTAQSTPTPVAQAGHEYSPLVEKTVNYKNWTLNDIKTDKPVDLRAAVQGKKLVMVVYFAPWCGNWRHEAPVAARLYEKYKNQGFEVIGVSEYGSRDEVKKFFGDAGAPYTVVSESETREDREKTPHYGYRQLTGDTRRWGSPWNIFLEPALLAKTGDLLTQKAWVVNGELIEEEVDKFIAERLKGNTAALEPCKQ